MRVAPVINEYAFHPRLSPGRMDELWRTGWRHFGPEFVRYSYSAEEGVLRVVQPLRVDLTLFVPAKQHRRRLARNRDLEVRIAPPELDEQRQELFRFHRRRFRRNVPESLADFLGPSPELYPCEVVEVSAWKGPRLVAASYLDVGREGASSIYAMFDLREAARGLGICTMLWEMDHAKSQGCRYYYPGYAFHEPSALDYKKQFSGAEWFDWLGAWHPL